MQSLKIIGLLLSAGVLAVVALVIIESTPRIQLDSITPPLQIANFDECVAAGNPVMESYPRQCRSSDGQLFIEPIQPENTVPSNNEPPSSQSTGSMRATSCAVAGCSGQLCVSSEEASSIVTTCEFRTEYACYKEAKCEVQRNGSCGWTMTPELGQCLASPGNSVETNLEVL